MLGTIAVTDRDWFEFLRLQHNLDEVRFWRPSDTRKPRHYDRDSQECALEMAFVSADQRRELARARGGPTA